MDMGQGDSDDEETIDEVAQLLMGLRASRVKELGLWLA